MIIAVILAAIVVGILAIREHVQMKRTMDSIGRMLQAAMGDGFSEKDFNESRLSRLETEFVHYLSSSAVSAKVTAQERDKIKTLISDISHQTKTPIANLLLYSELLEESSLTDDQRSNVEAVHKQIEKLRFLIDSLVKLSRLENGILQLNPRKELISVMLQDVYDEMQPKAEQKGLILEMIPTHTSAVFDPKWTAEAIGNIVENAIKYTESGKVTLSVTAYELFVRVDIQDTGAGIAEKEQAQIFGRFYRGEGSGDQEGVGVGLYLAREIIAAENGYIKVTSVYGNGSTFSVFLPK